MNGVRVFGLGFFSLLLSSLSIMVNADEAKRLYFGIDGHYLSNTIGRDGRGQAEFNFSTIGFRGGYYLEPQVAIELYGAIGGAGSQDLGIDMTLASTAGILGRFESPEREDGTKLFILLGYGMSELEMKRSENSLLDRELYHGIVYGGGAEFRIKQSKRFINIQGLRYYDEEGIALDGISLGFRQAL